MLDDNNILNIRDRSGALQKISDIVSQTLLPIELINPENDNRKINEITFCGMGGSDIAFSITKTLLSKDIKVPVLQNRDYCLPAYISKNSLVVFLSYSGNTEEILACVDDALCKGAEIAIITSGGELKEIALKKQVTLGLLPSNLEPRNSLIISVKAILKLLQSFNLVSTKHYKNIESINKWLQNEVDLWGKDKPIKHNYAKQLALLAVGKTPIFYSGPLMQAINYSWKVSLNENAKNVAFCNTIPEFNHNEFTGWLSHPIEKPYAIFDILSELENPHILKRFALTDRLLSGLRPKSVIVPIAGNSLVKQLFWGYILGQFVGTYVGILNNVSPLQDTAMRKLQNELKNSSSTDVKIQ